MELLRKVEYIYIVLSLFFGLILIFFTPPLQSADEPAHFAKACSFAQGHFLSKKLNGIAGDFLPESLVDFQSKYDNLFFNTSERTSFAVIQDSQKIKLNENKKVFLNQKYHAMYSPVAYIPQGIGVWFFKFFTDSVYWLMIGGKLFSLIFYILLGYYSVKSIPIAKWVCVLILLMPMSLSLGASVSADGVLIAVSILFFSKVLQYALSEDELSLKQLILLSVLSLSLALIKQSVLLSLFVLFIPKSKFGNRAIFKLIAILLPAFLVSFIWSKFSYTLFVPMNNSNPEIQVQFIFAHPFVYLMTLAKTLKAYFLPLIYSSIGILGWLDVFMFPFMYWVYIAVLGLNLFSMNDSFKNYIQISLFQKLLLFFVVCLNFFVICTIIYVSWAVPYLISPFEGLQGRYFIPLILPFLIFIFLLFKKNFVKMNDSIISTINIIFLILAYLNIVFGLYIRYYATF